MTRLGLVIALWVGLASSMALALPFVPADDAEILERLPVSPLDPRARRLRSLRRELAVRPDDLGVATRVAWLYIEQGRAQSDPRYYGYAEAALAPWWGAAEPPVPVLVLRATILQHNHDFEGAMRDLSAALAADSHNAQAWLTRAVILQVRGDFAEARRGCTPLMELSRPLLVEICVSGVESLNGGARKSYAALHEALAQGSEPSAGIRLWALTLLAEIAARMGQAQRADEHFRQALSLGLADDYLLGAYADFLLDQGRPAEVVALLKDAARADALLLRLALAEARIASPDLPRHVDALRGRFAAGRRRGDSVHQREESRFNLHLLQQPRAALQLAGANWAVQREPADARVLLEAAVAANDRAAAQPVLDFLSQTGLEDVHLAALRQRLSAGRP